MLKAGRVTVNGKKEKSAKLQIDEKIDEIRFDGKCWSMKSLSTT